MAGILDMMGYIDQKGQEGRLRGQQTRLGQLYSGAMQAPREQRQGYLGEMAKVSPKAAFSAEQHFGKMDEQGRQKLGQYAAAFSALPPDQKAAAYPRFAEMGRSLGIPVPQGDYQPAFDQGIQQLGQSFGNAKNGQPAGYQEFDMLAKDANLSPDDRALAARRALYLDRRPSNAAMSYKMVPGSDGVTRLVAADPNDPEAQVIEPPGAPQQGMAGQQLYASVEDIVGPLGGRITSTNGGQHNRGSLHPSGRAVDIGMGQESPEQQQKILGALQASGYKVRDERTKPAGQEVWSGPHLHVEAPGGGVNPFASRRPEDQAAATTAATEQAKLAAQNANFGNELDQTRQTEGVKTQAAIDQASGTQAAKAQTDRQFEQPQAQLALNDANANLDRLAVQANTLLNHPGLGGITGVRGSIPDVPGTDAANARAEFEALKSQIGFSVLQAMRNASKTGGALGQVSENENKLLQSNLAALANSQSTDQFQTNLRKVIQYVDGAKQRLSDAYRETYSGQQSQQTQQGGRLKFNPATGRIE